jgi:HSP20 family protein
MFSPRDQMDQLFSQALGSDTTKSNGGAEYVNLPVDIRQQDDRFVIEASVPGFKPEDVEVTYDDGVLTVRGQVNSDQETKQGGYVRRERRMSSVFRQVSLPIDVRAEEMTARFENGVLTITVRRAVKAQPKRIPVTPGDANEATVVEAGSTKQI